MKIIQQNLNQKKKHYSGALLRVGLGTIPSSKKTMHASRDVQYLDNKFIVTSINNIVMTMMVSKT